MRAPPALSISCADLHPGTRIADFRLERVIGHGSRATVYEATQLSLDRRVALKIMRDRSLADRVRRLTWPTHPGAVSLFGAGDSEHGPWLAMRLLPGGTLETARAPLDQVAAALAHGHAAGVVHGDVTARNVLVDGDHAYLSDFGLASGTPTAEEDRAALAQLVRDHPPPRRRPRSALLAGAATATAVVVLAGVLTAGSGSDGTAAAAPAVPPGARSTGSDLRPGDIESLDCSGRPADGASRPCTVSQLVLSGRETVVPVDGTITSWAVRGARGQLSLQVLRGRGRRFNVVDQSATRSIPGPAPHSFRSDLAVAAGDRIGLEVAPGAAVGVRRGAAQTSTDRWFSPLHADLHPRRPDLPAGTGFDHELLLRAHVRPGRQVDTIAPLRGDDAAGARDGLQLASRDVGVGGEVRRVTVVSLGSAVAIDLFDGARRLARRPIPDADGRGRLEALGGRAGTVRVRWRNSSGTEVDHTLEVTRDGLSRSDRPS